MKYAVAFLFTFLAVNASSEIPNIFVDPGACPGEACGYCALYAAEDEVPVFEKASTGSERIGKIVAGETFLSKTGEVHTVPTRFEVHRESGPFKLNDDVYAVTYLGEGYFRVFHNGELIRAELGFSPWGGTPGKTCDDPEFCFGRLTQELDFTWWLFVISEAGLEGWVVADAGVRQIERRW